MYMTVKTNRVVLSYDSEIQNVYRFRSDNLKYTR